MSDTAHLKASWLTAVAGVYLLVLWTVMAHPQAQTAAAASQSIRNQSQDAADRKSTGCLTCHTTDEKSMHEGGVRAGCEDCHGGKASVLRPSNVPIDSAEGVRLKKQAHDVEPRLNIWKTAANPAGVWYRTIEEDARFIRFVNPGDLRVADKACGDCHAQEVAAVGKSMMRHGGMLWGAAAYNNGSYPFKNSQFGEFYTESGLPAIANTTPTPNAATTASTGILPFLQPLFPFQVTQPGNLLRVFERGGGKPLEPGNPNPDELAGRPMNRLSNRGLGTLNRTDPVFIGLQKTRLLDPTLNFIGSNDAPGDYQSGGCTACHVIYANDRSPVHSGAYASAGNMGRAQTSDATISKTESGHPIKHVMTNGIPTSQCMTCHMHPGTNMLATYLGVTWWDNETDGARLYPAAERTLSSAQRVEIETRNPEGSALRGLWSDPAFLARTGAPEGAPGTPATFNSSLKQTQFADFHGHGWLFRAVFKRDRHGTLIDSLSQPVADTSTKALAEAVAFVDLRPSEGRPATAEARAMERAGKVVHLKDIHLERGMQCVDCHFRQDAHGNGNLYSEPRNGIEITCIDCHGTTSARATLRTSGPAAPSGGLDLTGSSPDSANKAPTGPGGISRFERDRRTGEVIQHSALDVNLSWVIPQVIDSITPGNPRYSEKSRLAKTIQRDGATWGDGTSANLAHRDNEMTCQTCHSSWVTSCFGCHLSQSANQKRDLLHNEMSTTRNWTSYNFQVLRDDVFMLGKDGSVMNGKISPVRSSSAVVVSSEDINRQTIYSQQQTVSAEGYAGQAFNTHVPHTVRTKETKTCTDCHVSSAGDNNAVMAQLLLLGTNFVNFMGRFVYVATGTSGIEAVAVTESSEPQAVIGSDLQKIAYPKAYASHQARGKMLTTAIGHGTTNALGVQARGEYLYVADGAGGFRALDIAEVNQKGFSQKIVSAPVSPVGQKTTVSSGYATAIAAPSTLAVDPARTQLPVNEEQKIASLYAYLYVADRDEGLVVTTAATLLDGNPSNNFLKRVAAFNPAGQLKGASAITVAGRYAYILCDRGLVVVDINDPLKLVVAGEVASPAIRKGTAITIQFRYAFVTDGDGLKVVDVTMPERPRLVTEATLPIANARGLYVARTYAYVAAGTQGIVIVDVERPEHPRVDQVFNGGGVINDANDVKVAMTNASLFAYVADGKNGLRVLQLVSANETAGAFGFSPRPVPTLIATYKTRGPALSISKGLDRDRAVDESGNQVAVFGRRGGRPLNLDEMRRMFMRNGQVFTVSDTPPGPPRPASAVTRLLSSALTLFEGR